jgi:guanosine-3',5'-bis(diphosphate) 3'-pyrophosphohydrolase
MDKGCGHLPLNDSDPLPADPECLTKLLNKVSYFTSEQREIIRRAFWFGASAHVGQTRKSGEPYITHPLSVAGILADIHLDSDSLTAAILHDVVEDTPITHREIAQNFGDDVANLVDGVTKLGKLEFSSPQEAQAENFRKMIMAMARDLRVILIKLADRLHNLRTLGVMRPDKRQRIARETLEIYAPIAARLGINAWRIELEDLCFHATYPMRANALGEAVRKSRGNRKELVEQITSTIQYRLEQEGIKAEVKGREKHLYSLYKKMRKNRLKFHEVLDIYAFRIIVENVDQCYRVLGMAHALYKPLPGRFKDYIAIPKANGYQSLHTILFANQGVYIEVQIRSADMHKIAEHGVAAHWSYKLRGSTKVAAIDQRAQEWVKHLLEMQQSAGNSLDFLENVKIDLFPDVIYVFTPDGDIKTLPRGATVIDFAYAVHTNLGHHCIGARVDRMPVPLKTQLQNGQAIEIIRGQHPNPNPNWLDFVITAKARSQVRHFMKTQHSEDAIGLGERLLKKALRTLGVDTDQAIDIATQSHLLLELKVSDWSELLKSIGLGNRLPALVAKQIADGLQEISTNHTDHTPLQISGTEGLALHYAQCCHPIPGDCIMGFISSERGLVIHRTDCPNLTNFRKHPEKWLDVSWEAHISSDFPVAITIESENKRGVLATVANAIATEGANIENVRTEDKDNHHSVMFFTIAVKDRNHLDSVLKRLRNMSDIFSAERSA